METICGFRGCEATIPSDSPFDRCDTCRFLDMRDRIATVLDPFAPNRPAHSQAIINDFVTKMTPDEYIRFVNNQEFLYLESKKLQLLYMPKGSTGNKRIKLTLQEQIDEARSLPTTTVRAPRANKASKSGKLTTLQQFMQELGCTDPTGTTGTCSNCTHAKQASEFTTKLTVIQRQMKQLGCRDPRGMFTGTDKECLNCRHEAEARRIFNDDFGDL